MSPLGVREAVERLEPVLGPMEREPSPLPGGFTNLNFRVRMGGRELVLRLCEPGAGVLGIDREGEKVATRRAADAGIGPELVACLEDDQVLVTEWLPGGPFAVRRGLADVAAALRLTHAGPPLPSELAVFALAERHHAIAVERGAPVPAGYATVADLASRIADALAGHPEHAPVACHNDLVPENFLTAADGGVRIVDWEYAGQNDRFFDLGNLSVNNDLTEDDDRALLAAYFGEPATPRRFAALRLMRIVSDVREAMWGLVQSAISRLDEDYDAYAAECFARLLDQAGDPRVEGWLTEARG